MARQEINYKLIDNVRRKINSMCDAEVRGEGDAPLPQWTDAASLDFLQKRMWGDLYGTPTMTNPLLLCTDKSVHSVTFTVKGLQDMPGIGRSGTSLVFSCNLKNTPRHEWVTEDARVHYPRCEVTRDEHPDLEKFAKWWDSVAEIRGRWLKVYEQVTAFLKANTTLNKALELWPDVRVYIPEEYLERVARKTERTATGTPVPRVKPSEQEALEALKAVDTTLALSSAVSARLVSASA
jgi:hypothetical protein